MTEQTGMDDVGIAKPSAVRRVIDHVLERIRSGEYAPGQIIVARHLMTELDLSKAPVREGIHVLVGEGVMELLPNRSARIRRLNGKDMADFAEVWAAIAATNIRLAARRIDQGDGRRRVAEAIARIETSARTRVPYEFFLAVGNLHSILAEIADNSFTRAFIERSHFAHFYRHLERQFPGAHWRKHVSAFSAVGAALADGDGERAEAAYRRHMQWALEHMHAASAAAHAGEDERKSRIRPAANRSSKLDKRNG